MLDDLTRPFVPLVGTAGGVVPLLVFTKAPFPFVYPSLKLLGLLSLLLFCRLSPPSSNVARFADLVFSSPRILLPGEVASGVNFPNLFKFRPYDGTRVWFREWVPPTTK